MSRRRELGGGDGGGAEQESQCVLKGVVSAAGGNSNSLPLHLQRVTAGGLHDLSRPASHLQNEKQERRPILSGLWRDDRRQCLYRGSLRPDFTYACLCISSLHQNKGRWGLRRLCGSRRNKAGCVCGWGGGFWGLPCPVGGTGLSGRA